ncbi:hypothetical protein FF38_11085 [Lucilia cuprina]|uniref:Uncharacterized protein n=1 Tax=Lucilia cuprina TaxID=7375 RepID=A0A0L0CRG5_LUCCU|nr:hypothetical protein FF38_11085 [Lucilia cuprina]
MLSVFATGAVIIFCLSEISTLNRSATNTSSLPDYKLVMIKCIGLTRAADKGGQLLQDLSWLVSWLRRLRDPRSKSVYAGFLNPIGISYQSRSVTPVYADQYSMVACHSVEKVIIFRYNLMFELVSLSNVFRPVIAFSLSACALGLYIDRHIHVQDFHLSLSLNDSGAMVDHCQVYPVDEKVHRELVS